jgi:hypothetical protein
MRVGKSRRRNRARRNIARPNGSSCREDQHDNRYRNVWFKCRIGVNSIDAQLENFRMV